MAGKICADKPLLVGPVLVAAVEWLSDPEGVRAETVAVGGLHVVPQLDLDITLVSVGDTWAYPLLTGQQVVHVGRTFLLPSRGSGMFAVALPSTAPEEDFAGWLAALQCAGCLLVEELPARPSCDPVTAIGAVDHLQLEATTFLGLERDACSAEKIELSDGTYVSKGKSNCILVELDSSGYFYWKGTSGRTERTRPRWQETNCIVCRREPTGRRITWECHHVPSFGEEPAAAHAAHRARLAATDAEKAALWASRKERASRAATLGLRAVASAAPAVASGVRMAAKGAATALEIGGEMARDVVPAAEQPIRVDPQLRQTVSVVRDVSQAGADACQAARSGIESGAQLVGEAIAARMSQSSSDGSTQSVECDERACVSKKLCDAGEEAASGIGQVIAEVKAAKSLLRQHTAKATCAIVGARYGSEAEETLGMAFEASGSAREFYADKTILSKRGAASAAAVACARGAIDGGSTSEDHVVSTEPTEGFNSTDICCNDTDLAASAEASAKSVTEAA